ncbi:MAG: RNA polymerase subunit sigma-54 [Salinibacter sp.]
MNRGVQIPDERRQEFRAYLLAFVLIVGVSLLLPPSSSAQRQSGDVGVGFQVGRPGGLALKWYRPGTIGYDAIIGIGGDDFVTASIHRLWERPLPDSPLHYYVGPGLIVGPEGLSQTPPLHLGLSAELGLNFYAERFEVFLHVTPTLRFLPDTRVGIDGNVGLRYYLRAF